MQAASYFEVTWYTTRGKNRLVLDKIEPFNDKVRDLMDDPDVISFFVMTHNTMPKE